MEQLGEQGKVEESMKLLKEVEAMKHKKGTLDVCLPIVVPSVYLQLLIILTVSIERYSSRRSSFGRETPPLRDMRCLLKHL